MKKMIAILCTGILTMGLLTGCQDTEKEKELENQIAQLEQQVTDLKNSQNASEQPAETTEEPAADNASTSAQASEGAAEQKEEVSPAADSTASKTPASIEELTASVTAYVDKINQLENVGSIEDAFSQYSELNMELETIENSLDMYEDNLEHQFRSGALTADDFRTKEHEAEALEDQLDNMDDQLEFIFGIDD